MGMFDYYVPRTGLKCPECETSLDALEWQGKDGRNKLKTYREKRAEMVQIANTFKLYTSCPVGHWVTAMGWVNRMGHWYQTVIEVVDPEIWP